MTNQQSPPLLMSVKEFAALIGKSENSVYKRLQKKAIPERLVVKSGRKIELRRAAVMRWLEGEDAA